MQEHDRALVVALVRSHVMSEPEYMSWVPAYVKVRWSPGHNKCVGQWVGGHWRRKAVCKRTIDALACVCKQPILAEPDRVRCMPHVGRKRNR